MQLMATDWYRAAFPATVLAADFARRDHFKTTKGGELIATALGGAITGEGGRTIIIDDPLDAKDANTEKRERVNQLYAEKIQSRLNNQALGRILSSRAAAASERPLRLPHRPGRVRAPVGAADRRGAHRLSRGRLELGAP